MLTSFTKAQGAGNDFILFDLTRDDAAEKRALDWAAIAQELCDRHFGIGADGVILVLPASDGEDDAAGSAPAAPKADYRMRIFNADGSEPEICGNGLRCFVRYLHDHGMMTGGPTVAVETGAGVKRAEVLTEASELQIRLDMGLPFDQGRETLALEKRKLDVSLISIGNPHAVSFVSDLDKLPFAELGPAVSEHTRFRNGINAEFAQLLSRSRVRVKVWERGAGPTLACGSGACAVVVAGVSRGLTERRVAVELPGGTLTIEWQVGGSVFLTGPAELVFTGQITLPTPVLAETEA